MRRSVAWGAVLLLALATGEGSAQSQGTAEGSPGTESAPVIIEERAPREDREEARILSEEEAFVQIRGAWATDEAACANVDQDNGGLYVTDTLIRWEEATCNIRNIDSQNGVATVYTLCATETGRRERTYHLEASGEDQLTLRFLAGAEQQEVALTRCPSTQ